MGTRGLFGFCYNGKYYIFYNHWDSYPEGLGADLVAQLKIAIENEVLDEWKVKILELQDITGIEPTSDQIEKLSRFTDLSVSSQSTSDWYCLLRKTQGSLQNILDAGYIQSEITTEPPHTDLFIEYVYVINLDANYLEFSDHGYEESYPFNSLPDW